MMSSLTDSNRSPEWSRIKTPAWIPWTCTALSYGPLLILVIALAFRTHSASLPLLLVATLTVRIAQVAVHEFGHYRVYKRALGRGEKPQVSWWPNPRVSIPEDVWLDKQTQVFSTIAPFLPMTLFTWSGSLSLMMFVLMPEGSFVWEWFFWIALNLVPSIISCTGDFYWLIQVCQKPSGTLFNDRGNFLLVKLPPGLSQEC